MNQYGDAGEQVVEIAFITEGDVYRLIVNSKLPSAERFEPVSYTHLDVYKRQVVGGGCAGQAGAIRHGLSRALLQFDPCLLYTSRCV